MGFLTDFYAKHIIWRVQRTDGMAFGQKSYKNLEENLKKINFNRLLRSHRSHRFLNTNQTNLTNLSHRH